MPNSKPIPDWWKSVLVEQRAHLMVPAIRILDLVDVNSCVSLSNLIEAVKHSPTTRNDNAKRTIKALEALGIVKRVLDKDGYCLPRENPSKQVSDLSSQVSEQVSESLAGEECIVSDEVLQICGYTQLPGNNGKNGNSIVTNGTFSIGNISPIYEQCELSLRSHIESKSGGILKSDVRQISDLWNELPGTIHHKATTNYTLQIRAAIKSFGFEAVELAIRRYSTWLVNTEGKYRTAYPWTLGTFLSREKGRHVAELSSEYWERKAAKISTAKEREHERRQAELQVGSITKASEAEFDRQENEMNDLRAKGMTEEQIFRHYYPDEGKEEFDI